MLRRTSGVSRPVLKWVSQVAASLGATLSATLIWSAVPHPGAAPTASPELTSGGKFAARAVQPVAYDGLDTMPLPRPAPPPARFVAVSFEAAPVSATSAAPRHPAWEETPAGERRSARAAHLTARAEARRPEPASATTVATAATAAATTTAAPAPAAPEPAPEEGFLHRVVPSALPAIVPAIMPAIASTAREAWSATASAGDVLVSHVVPRMP